MELKDLDVGSLKLLAQHMKKGLDEVVAEVMRRRPEVTELWVFSNDNSGLNAPRTNVSA